MWRQTPASPRNSPLRKPRRHISTADTYERIGAKRLLHNRGKAVGLLPEVHGARRHENLYLRSSRDHDALRTARSTATSTEVSTWPMMRTTASPTAISTLPEPASGGCEAAGEEGAGALLALWGRAVGAG